MGLRLYAAKKNTFNKPDQMNHTILFTAFLFILSCTNLFGQQKGDVYLIAGLFYDSEQNTFLKNKVIHVNGSSIQNIGDESIIPELSLIHI